MFLYSETSKYFSHISTRIFPQVQECRSFSAVILLEKEKHGHLAITICNVKMGKASQCLFQAVNYTNFTNGKIYASINDLLASLCQKGDQSQGFLS